MVYVMAFDFERAGRKDDSDVIGFGASVVGEDFRQKESLFCPMLRADTVFQKACWDGFWADKPDVLEKLYYKGSLPKEELEHDTLRKFHELRIKWEVRAAEEKTSLEILSDNMLFDGHILNSWYTKYMPDTHPLPYTASKGTYSGDMWETDSMLRGMLIGMGYKVESPWGLTEAARLAIKAPEPEFKATHLPHEDAYSIAYDGQLVHKAMAATNSVVKRARAV